MWYLIKQALIPIAYLFFSSIIASGVFSIENCDPVIMVVLLSLNLAVYIFVVATLYNKEGTDAYNVLVNNDANRRRIIETGDDLPLNLTKEYAPWKGFAIGGIICIPLVVLMLVHTVLILFGQPDLAPGAIASFIYMVVFAFTRIDITIEVGVYDYYIMLVFIPIVVIISGVSYIKGAKKVERQQKMIQQMHAEIHGGKR